LMPGFVQGGLERSILKSTEGLKKQNNLTRITTYLGWKDTGMYQDHTVQKRSNMVR
jgi:hypothetical protein